MSSSSKSAAPAVVDKHAALLKMVNKCTHYKCTLCDKEHKRKKIFLIFFFFLVVTQHSGAHVLHALLHGSDRCVS